jgi:hypothetical protein
MQALTLTLYWLVAAFSVAAGLVAVVAPSAILPDLTPLASHLAREEGAAFVFIGLVAAWCARHPEFRRPAHYAFLVLTGLFSGIHWWGYLSTSGYAAAALVNSIPFAAFAATLPATRASN